MTKKFLAQPEVVNITTDEFNIDGTNMSYVTFSNIYANNVTMKDPRQIQMLQSYIASLKADTFSIEGSYNILKKTEK